MKITRVINGETVEIELTPAEMEQAAEEQMQQTHRTYLTNQISDLDEADDRAILKHLQGDALTDALDDMLIYFEMLIGEDYDWFEAWRQVSDEYIQKPEICEFNAIRASIETKVAQFESYTALDETAKHRIVLHLALDICDTLDHVEPMRRETAKATLIDEIDAARINAVIEMEEI